MTESEKQTNCLMSIAQDISILTQLAIIMCVNNNTLNEDKLDRILTIASDRIVNIIFPEQEAQS